MLLWVPATLEQTEHGDAGRFRSDQDTWYRIIRPRDAGKAQERWRLFRHEDSR